MKSLNTKSSDELKKEVHDELGKVRSDLNQMQGRLSPGQLIDDAIFQSHGRSPAASFEHLKNNPIGTTFLSLGTLLLMEDETHSSYEKVVQGKVNSSVTSLKEGIKQQLPHKELLPGMAPNKADLAKQKITGARDAFNTKVKDIKKDLSKKVTDNIPLEDIIHNNDESFTYPGSSESKLEDVKAKVSSKLETGKEKIKNLDNSSFMVIGAALGALTGASLPVSDAEDSFVTDKFQGKLSDFNSDLKNALNESANVLKDLVVKDVKDLNLKVF